MKTTKINQFTKGWFIGDFVPTLYKTKEFEIGVKSYSKGSFEPKHIHKIATEYTIIISGTYKINSNIYKSGDILILSPGEASDFQCLKTGKTVVVKTPSVHGDKYIGEQ